MTAPDPEPDEIPAAPSGTVQPGETPPASSQMTEGLAHQTATSSSGISWGFVIAILVLVLLIGGGAIAAGISYL